MKKVSLLLLSFVLLFTVAACGGGSQTGGATDSDPAASEANSAVEEEPVTLRIAWWGSKPRHDYTLKVIEMYEKQHPHVTIKPEFAEWADYWKKLAPQAAANQLPDVLQMDLSYLTQYGSNNQLADLQPFIDDGTIDVSSISDSAVSGGMLGDKLYGFNLGVNAFAIVTDFEKLKTIGIEPQKDWTWDDFEEIALKVQDELGLYSYSGTAPKEFFSYYLRTKGKHLYSADGNSLGYEDDQLFVDFFGRMVRLVEAGAIPTPDIPAQIKGLEDQLIIKEKSVFEWGWSNFYFGYSNAADRPIGLHPMPGPGQDQGYFLKPSMFFSISKNSKHKEEAAKFINFFVNNVEANKLIMGDRGVPVSSEVKEALNSLLSEEQKHVFEFVEWAEAHSSKMDPPDPLGSSEVVKELETLTEQMYFGKISPEEAAVQFREKANSILTRE